MSEDLITALRYKLELYRKATEDLESLMDRTPYYLAISPIAIQDIFKKVKEVDQKPCMSIRQK